MAPQSSSRREGFLSRAKRKLSGQSSLTIEALEDRLALSATYSTVNDWGSGLQGQIAINNDQPAALKDWRLEFDYSRTISNLWDAQVVSHVGTHYVLQGASYNNTIAVGQTISIGFIAGAGTDVPRNVMLNLSLIHI